MWAGGILINRLPCAWIVCRSLSFRVLLLYPYLPCIKHTAYIFSLNYLYAHKTTNLTSFMVDENGNNCLSQLATCIVIPKCNSINNYYNDDGAAVNLSTPPHESHLKPVEGVFKCSLSWSSVSHSLYSQAVLSAEDRSCTNVQLRQRGKASTGFVSVMR